MTQSIDTYHQLFNNICYVFTILTTIADCIHLVISLGFKYPVISIVSPINYIMITADSFFFISTIILYIILFVRVYLPFKDSIYSISCWSLFTVIVLMFITLCAMFAYGYIILQKYTILSDLQPMVYILWCLVIF